MTTRHILLTILLALALVVTASAIIEAAQEVAAESPAPSPANVTARGVPTEAQARTAVVGALVAAQIAGTASWYCGDVCTKGYPAGSMVAAAGSELRSQGWRGSWVTVTRGDRSVVVQLVDWCGCPGSRVIDLYGAAFQRLADTSAGLIDVTVTHGLAVAARPTPPATDSTR